MQEKKIKKNPLRDSPCMPQKIASPGPRRLVARPLSSSFPSTMKIKLAILVVCFLVALLVAFVDSLAVPDNVMVFGCALGASGTAFLFLVMDYTEYEHRQR